MEPVLYSVESHVATIMLNRPERLNALDWPCYELLNDLFLKASADHEVRCIILTGSGRCFCSGDDVEAIMRDGGGLEHLFKAAPGEQQQSSTPPMYHAMMNSRVPIIGAINGAAVGAGIEMALLCDIRIASTAARFSEMFVKRGVMGTQISFDRLPELVGPAWAAEMLLTGDLVDAEKALRIGLVSQLTEPEQLLAAANQLAQRIVSNPPLAVEKAKQALKIKCQPEFKALDDYVSVGLADLVSSEDHKESVNAFLEKREPVYKGR